MSPCASCGKSMTTADAIHTGNYCAGCLNEEFYYAVDGLTRCPAPRWRFDDPGDAIRELTYALRYARDCISSPDRAHGFNEDIYDARMMSKALRAADAALAKYGLSDALEKENP